MAIDMTMSVLDNGTKLMKMTGRLDIEGVSAIDLRLTVETSGERLFLIADLSALDFMSSMGIGSLVRVVKTVRRRGGNMVILNPHPNSRLILEKTRIHELISMHTSLEAATAAVLSEERVVPKEQ